MLMLDALLATPPHFTNETGSFWLEEHLNKYAAELGLKKVNVFIVKFKDGVVTRLIVQDGQPEYENQSLEAIGAHLDIMALAAKASEEST